MMKLSFDWSNATSPERRDLIFQNRNKEYGGYEIRKNYNKHVAFALLITLTSLGLIVVVPIIISRYSEKFPEIIPKITDQVKTMEQFEFEKPIIQKTNPVTLEASVKSEKFDVPKLVEKIDHNEIIATQDQLLNTNAGTASTAGTESINLPTDDVPPVDTVTPRISADIMPVFPGGEENLFRYLSKIKYLVRAREENISGLVYLFVKEY